MGKDKRDYGKEMRLGDGFTHQHQHCCPCFYIFSSLSPTLLVFLYFLAMPQALCRLIFLHLAIKYWTTSQL